MNEIALGDQPVPLAVEGGGDMGARNRDSVLGHFEVRARCALAKLQVELEHSDHRFTKLLHAHLEQSKPTEYIHLVLRQGGELGFVSHFTSAFLAFSSSPENACVERAWRQLSSRPHSFCASLPWSAWCRGSCWRCSCRKRRRPRHRRGNNRR